MRYVNELGHPTVNGSSIVIVAHASAGQKGENDKCL